MVNASRYSARCVLLPLLLLLLLARSWRAASGHPLRAGALSAEQCARCSGLFGSLLTDITALLHSEDIRFGITSDAVVMHSEAETLQACVPTVTQTSGCMMPRGSPFNESECLKNIMKDLSHYRAAIESYLARPLRNQDKETKLLTPTLEIIKSLMKHCSLDEGNGSSEALAFQGNAAPLWGNSSFDNRREMYKMMKGFYIRTITINRAMGYISSGDHRK